MHMELPSTHSQMHQLHKAQRSIRSRHRDMQPQIASWHLNAPRLHNAPPADCQGETLCRSHVVTDPGYRENKSVRGRGNYVQKRRQEAVFRKSNRETSGEDCGGVDGEIWYLTSGVGGQEASMGRERLTAKDIERERQMELEQKLTAGIEEQQVCELIAGSFFRLSLSQGRMCIGWSQLKINSYMSLGLILELKGPSSKAATSQDATQSEWC
ncbi:hypothetical protein QQF64_031887 [Cirrhinus molitorella]|uniref:Uncharacterized protein n=1 Tax=Cirrhinus molitorella TaxID=172907 RepID=A0ABR3MY79_9TELE